VTARLKTALRSFLPAFLLFLGVLAAFAPSLGNGFVNWDDGPYIIDNVWIRGLALKNLCWMLTAARGGLWQPLTWLTFALNYRVSGLEPSGYHLTNILLHAATTLLFYAVCLRLFQRARPDMDQDDCVVAAILAAFFFAVHPLRVESVVWATERKDVLAGFFCMAALLAYLKAVESRAGRRGLWETAAVAAFALSLAAKVSGATLPVVLLILEVYPLRRFPVDPRRWLNRSSRPILLSVAPYFALAVVGSLLNIAAAIGGGTLPGFAERGIAGRFDQALYSLLFYPAKTLWPSTLSAYYPPQPWFGHWSTEFFAYAALVLIAVIALWLSAKRRPAIGAAAVCYAVMVAPMSGLAQHGMVFSAWNHFSYLPCLGFATLFGIVFARRGARVLGTVWIALLGVATWTQCGVWRDSTTLWSTTVSIAPSGVALNNLADALSDTGRFKEGLARFEEAVSVDPTRPLGYDNLGRAFQRIGDLERAREAWRRGLQREATPEIHDHLGNSLATGDHLDVVEGIAHLRAAVSMDPISAPFRVDLADALVRAGRRREAESQYAAAAGLDPEVARAQNNWGLLLAGRGRLAEAVSHYRLALYEGSARAEAQYNWANVLLESGKLGAAERRYREALRLEPGLARAQVNLGNILARRGDFAEAAVCYRAALKKDSGLYEARANLTSIRRALGN